MDNYHHFKVWRFETFTLYQWATVGSHTSKLAFCATPKIWKIPIIGSKSKLLQTYWPINSFPRRAYQKIQKKLKEPVPLGVSLDFLWCRLEDIAMYIEKQGYTQPCCADSYHPLLVRGATVLHISWALTESQQALNEHGHCWHGQVGMFF